MANKTEEVKTLHPYGTPGFIQTLAWHDEVTRDYLVVVDEQPVDEVMKARAKGTTPYELINIYGGIDAVTEAFAYKEDDSQYGDFSNIPEFSNDEEYAGIINNLNASIEALKAKMAEKKEAEKKEAEKKEAVEDTGGNNDEQ